MSDDSLTRQFTPEEIAKARAILATAPVERGEPDAVREAVEGERLTDDTGHPQDIAYNQAIADALAALDRIAEH